MNDYWVTGHTSTKTKNNLLAIRKIAKAQGAVVLVGSLTKVLRSYQTGWVAAVNQQLKPYISIDFNSISSKYIYSDGLHPTKIGYQKMATLAFNRLHAVSSKLEPKLLEFEIAADPTQGANEP